MTIAAVVTAAGYGTRLGSAKPKALVTVAGRSLLEWALLHVTPVASIVVVTAPPTHVAEIQAVCDAAALQWPDAAVQVVAGAETRQASVAAGLDALASSSPEADIIMVHDAARAFMPTETMRTAVAAVAAGADGAIPLVPLVDTLVASPAADGALGDNVDREQLRAVQTPQVFSASALRDAHEDARVTGVDTATDDATLVRALGYRVVGVDGHAWGFKVTRPEDIEWASHVAGLARQVGSNS